MQVIIGRAYDTQYWVAGGNTRSCHKLFDEGKSILSNLKRSYSLPEITMEGRASFDLLSGSSDINRITSIFVVKIIVKIDISEFFGPVLWFSNLIYPSVTF